MSMWRNECNLVEDSTVKELLLHNNEFAYENQVVYHSMERMLLVHLY